MPNIYKLSYTAEEIDAKLGLVDNVVATKTSNTIDINDAKAEKVSGFTLYGKTTQVGDPTPINPIELVSAGDSGTIDVTVYGENLIVPPFIHDTRIVNGVAFTNNGDGSFTVEGTATAAAEFSLNRIDLETDKWVNKYEPEGYHFSGLPSEVNLVYNPNYKRIGFLVDKGITVNATFYPKLKRGVTTTFQTPNGLLAVNSGSFDGTYTDEFGRTLVCDEIDLERKVYIQRLYKQTFDGTELWEEQWSGLQDQGVSHKNMMVTLDVDIVKTTSDSNVVPIASDCFSAGSAYDVYQCKSAYISGGYNNANCLRLHSPNHGTLASWKAYLSENPMTVIVALETPIERALTDEEIEAYSSLKLNVPSNTIVNDADACMVVKYPVDIVKTAEGQTDSDFPYENYGLPMLGLSGDVSAMTKENAVDLNYSYRGRTGVASVKWQGTSSIGWPKKNYTIKFDQAFEAAAGWGEQKKYCLKANYIDFSHARNVVSAKLWGQVVKTRKGNLFGEEEQSKVVNGIVENGTQVGNSAWRLSDYIEIPSVSKLYFYWLSSNTWQQVKMHYYDENKTFISSEPVGYDSGTYEWTCTFTVPGNTRYIRLNYSVDRSGTVIERTNIWLDTSLELRTRNELPNAGAIDGFPVCVVINGKYHGLYTFNIPKDGWMMGMGSGTNECIMCAESYSAKTVMRENVVCDGTDYSIEYISDESNTQWAIDSLNTLISAVIASDGSDIDSVLAKYVDINSVIDFYIFASLITGFDLIGKNHLLCTYDGVKWFYSMYDMDSTYGLWWTGKEYVSPCRSFPSIKDFDNRIVQLLKAKKKDAIKARYAELRAGALSDANVFMVFSNFIGAIPAAVYDAETELWPLIPNTSTNNLSQIIENYRMRSAMLDKDIENL